MIVFKHCDFIYSMASLVRQAPLVRQYPPRKVLFGIRHAEGWHNVLYDLLGMQGYSKFPDTSLTTEGMRQAAVAIAPKVDFVLVSPLMRTLQTANIMYPDTPQIALECLKEYPQHAHISNRRSETSLLRRLFPKVDFSDLTDERQPWPNPVDADENVKRVKEIVMNAKATRFAVVTHSTWLKYWMTGTCKAEPELIHCHPYKLVI